MKESFQGSTSLVRHPVVAIRLSVSPTTYNHAFRGRGRGNWPALEVGAGVCSLPGPLIGLLSRAMTMSIQLAPTGTKSGFFLRRKRVVDHPVAADSCWIDPTSYLYLVTSYWQ